MKSLLRVLGAVAAIVALSGAAAYVADDIRVGLGALFVIPLLLLVCVVVFGLLLEFVAFMRGVPRVGSELAKTANRGVYAVSGFDVCAALRRVAERWKESK